MNAPDPAHVAQPAPTLGDAIPILRVEALEASVAYYVERLGFALQWHDRPLASVGRGRASVMLSEGDQGRGGSWLWISTSGVDALWAELRERGARLLHPPTNYPWGSRECQVTDPDGHVLRFASEAPAGEPFGEWRDGSGRLWAPQSDGSWRETRTHTTRLTRTLRAPRPAVYRALVDRDAVAAWMVPDGMSSHVHHYDAREGGTFRISLTYESEDGKGKSSAHTDTYHGRFVELVPGDRVVRVMEFESDDPEMRGEMTTTMRLSDAPGGTRVDGEHAGVPQAVSPADNELGWSLALRKLARFVEAPPETTDREER